SLDACGVNESIDGKKPARSSVMWSGNRGGEEVIMTRRTFNRIARRLALGLVLAAVAVPATAQAMPIGKTSGPRASTVFVPQDPGQFRLGDNGAWFVPVDAGQL